jgi:hypothetical protein
MLQLNKKGLELCSKPFLLAIGARFSKSEVQTVANPGYWRLFFEIQDPNGSQCGLLAPVF